MISGNGSPFIYKDLKGTNWYKRFIAEEYYIILDQYPEREIIEDSELSRIISGTDTRLQNYKNVIIDFFINSEQDIVYSSFWDILITLRKIKANIFPEIERIYRDSLTALISAPKEIKKIRFDSPEIQTDLLKQFDKTNNILFIPGKPEFFKRDLIDWIPLHGNKKNIQILCFDNPVYRGVNLDFALEILNILHMDSIELLEIDRDKIDLTMLDESVQNEVLIFTTSIWSFLTCFQSITSIGFSLDNSEWCSRALFGQSYNYSEGIPSSYTEGKYKKILLNRKADNGISLAGLLQKPFDKNINISGVQYCPINLVEYIKKGDPLSFQEKIIENKQWLSPIIKQNGLKYISDFFTIKDNQVAGTSIADKNPVHIAAVIAQECSVKIKPLLFDSMIDITKIKTEGNGFFSSFNYYFTSNLVNLYNKNVPDNQKLKIENFFIDYIGLFEKKQNYESIPLFNKAFLGCTKDGILFSGHYLLKNIEMKIGNKIILFNENEINSENKTGIFLPSHTEEVVGNKKKCIVIIQDQIIYNGTGPCRIPPAGVVFVSDQIFEDTYKTVSFSITFKNLPYKKEKLHWMIGGFNLLVDKGTNCYKTHAESIKSLNKEGWFLQQSIETQETQLDPEKKQPRCVFGKSSKRRIIVAVFSGRTELSYGATFSECITYVKSFLDEDERLDFLVNLDGGASASLICQREGNFRNLSLTAPSAGNPAGTPRRLNAYLSLDIK